MKVEAYFKDILKEGKFHLTLLDPEEQTPEEAVEMAQSAIAGGTKGIMLGGSTNNGVELDATAHALQENIEVPIILFPGNTTGVSRYADAIFFMSLLNSTNPYWIIGAQALGAPSVKKIGIEAIPMGYIIVEPGGTAGWVGDAKLIPRDKTDLALAYGLAAEFLGMRMFYLEAGSGASKTIPPQMIAACKQYTDMTIVVGGGIRDGKTSYQIAAAGADVVVTGTVVEDCADIEDKIKEIVSAIDKAD